MFKAEQCPPGCAYEQLCSGGRSCGYIFIEGHSRGCDPGTGCTKYRKGKIRRSQQKSKAGSRATWDTAKAYRLWKSGCTDREIADALGITRRDTIGDYRRKHWGKVNRRRNADN